MSTGRRDDDPGALKRPPEQSEKRSGNPPDVPPEDDPIERLGKRIGRILSYLLAAALVIYLWHTYLRG